MITESELAAWEGSDATSAECEAMSEKVCRHCGRPPTAEMQRDHRFWPWVMSRTGPAGAWQHHYCSEECAAHADTYSREEYRRRAAL